MGRHGAGVGARRAPEQTPPTQGPATELHQGEGPEPVGHEPAAHTLSPPGSRTPRHHASMYAAADRAERVLVRIREKLVASLTG